MTASGLVARLGRASTVSNSLVSLCPSGWSSAASLSDGAGVFAPASHTPLPARDRTLGSGEEVRLGDPAPASPLAAPLGAALLACEERGVPGARVGELDGETADVEGETKKESVVTDDRAGGDAGVTVSREMGCTMGVRSVVSAACAGFMGVAGEAPCHVDVRALRDESGVLGTEDSGALVKRKVERL